MSISLQEANDGMKRPNEAGGTSEGKSRCSSKMEAGNSFVTAWGGTREGEEEYPVEQQREQKARSLPLKMWDNGCH